MTIERLAPKIATYIFTKSATQTTTGNYCVSFEEINNFYGITIEDNPELLIAVEDALYNQYGDGILDLEIYDNEFDLVLGFDYCVNEVDFEEEEE